ncbi:hypothetical protein NC652_034177 [Populus alba x Populus x berolinensis]|nr:hypothetical protein NC652_034177 [Populus alba x Populus x berolinensis]
MEELRAKQRRKFLSVTVTIKLLEAIIQTLGGKESRSTRWVTWFLPLPYGFSFFLYVDELRSVKCSVLRCSCLTLKDLGT